jgi:hypothetical protein
MTEYPVLNIGPNESWDDIRVCRPSVIIDDNQYKMWYSGHDGSRYKIGLAHGDIVTSINTTATNSLNSCAFPNPFINDLQINCMFYSQTQAAISIMNCNGQIVASTQSELNQGGEHTFYIDASAFKPGIYYYKITDGHQTDMGKIIKVY